MTRSSSCAPARTRSCLVAEYEVCKTAQSRGCNALCRVARWPCDEDGRERSLFDERNLIELTSEEHFPGERLIVCRNPLLAEERARKRVELLAATEADLAKIAAATQRARRPLRARAPCRCELRQPRARQKLVARAFEFLHARCDRA